LIPFEEATREFSGNTYVTLSKVVPTINEIIFDLATETPSNNDLFLDEDTVFGLEDKEIQPIDFDEEEIVSNITKKRILIKNPLNTTGILEKVKESIYGALIYYWNDRSDLGLMATLLDPRYKDLDFLGDDSEKQQTIQKLRDEYNEIKELVFESEPPTNSIPSTPGSSARSHKEYHQQRQMKRKKKDRLLPDQQPSDEILNYLSLPKALDTEDPFLGRKYNLKNFSNLPKLLGSTLQYRLRPYQAKGYFRTPVILLALNE